MIDSHIELFPIIQLTLSSGVRVYLSHRHRHTVKSQIRAKSFFVLFKHTSIIVNNNIGVRKTVHYMGIKLT